MQIVEVTSDNAILQLTRYDLEILHDALNEVTRDVTDEQFQERLGYSLRESKYLLEKLAKVYSTMTAAS